MSDALMQIPPTFQQLTDDVRAIYGEPELVYLRPPKPSNDTCREKLANWLKWRAAPYPASRHSEYLYKPDDDGETGPEILLSAVMPTPSSMTAYLEGVSRKRRYDVRARKALKHGYSARVIQPGEESRGIWEIVHSTEQRQGRPIVAMFGDRPPDYDFSAHQPTEDVAFDDICCGVFAPEGNLAAYLIGKRLGDHVQYEEIMGHAEHIQYDVMYLLHYSFLEMCVANELPPQCLNYGSWYSGTDPFSPTGGLNRWKRKVKFRPAYLILASS